MSETVTIRMAHSSDADDAFMWWALGDTRAGKGPAIDTGRYRFEMLADDIAVLNRRAHETGDLDVTALSMHAFAHVADRYRLLSCGNSFGDGYGPKVVAREEIPLDSIGRDGSRVAVPGERTTAFLLLRLMLGRAFDYEAMPFHEVIPAVAGGRYDAGLVIHEGQLTYRDAGLVELADEGAWWKRETGLALPLGANVVRRDLDGRYGAGTLRDVAALLKASLDAAFADRATGIRATSAYAHGMEASLVDEYVGMYVNPLTLDCGRDGERAMALLFARGADCGLLPADTAIDLVSPA